MLPNGKVDFKQANGNGPATGIRPLSNRFAALKPSLSEYFY
jgi:hypothetical protein